MRIRGGRFPSAADRGRHASPSTSSSSSSITAATAPSSSSLVSSSQDSSNSFPISLLEGTTTSSHRCHGLDLLVKAIHQVTAGSVIGVPYIQRRVTIRRRRRRRGFQFDGFVLTEIFGHHNNDKGRQQKNDKKFKVKQRKGKNSSASKARQRRGMGLPF